MKIRKEIENILHDGFDSEEITIRRLEKLFISKCGSIFDAGSEINNKPNESRNKTKLDWKYKDVSDYLKESGII